MRAAIVTLLIAGLLIACAAPGERQRELERTGEIYARHAGDRVEHVLFSGVRNWRPAGREGVVVEFSGRRHYLLGLTAPCDFEIQYAVRLRLINAQPNLLTRFDRVRVGGETCRITSIRPVNMEEVREELEQSDLDEPRTSSGIVVEQTDQDSGGT